MGESPRPRHLALVEGQAPAERPTFLLRERLRMISHHLIRAQFDAPSGLVIVQDRTQGLDYTDPRVLSRYDDPYLHDVTWPSNFSRAERIVQSLEEGADELPERGAFMITTVYRAGNPPTVVIGRRGEDGPEAWTLAFDKLHASENFRNLWQAGHFSPDLILQTLDEFTQDRSVIVEQVTPPPMIELFMNKISVRAPRVIDRQVVDDPAGFNKRRKEKLEQSFGKGNMQPGQIYCYVEDVRRQEKLIKITVGGEDILAQQGEGQTSGFFGVEIVAPQDEAILIGGALLKGGAHAQMIFDQLLRTKQATLKFDISPSIPPEQHILAKGYMGWSTAYDVSVDMVDEANKRSTKAPVWRVREQTQPVLKVVPEVTPRHATHPSPRTRFVELPAQRSGGRHALDTQHAAAA